MNPIHSITEFYNVLKALNAGESLVITEGRFFRGFIPENVTRKLKSLDVVLPGRKSHVLDGDGINEMIVSNSWVTSPGKAFINSWDTIRVKLAKDSDGFNPMMELLIDFIDSLDVESAESLQVDFKQVDSYKFMEISHPKHPLKFGVSVKSLKLRYYLLKDGTKITL